MLPQINIQSTMGRIGIRYTDLQWQLSSPAAALSVQTPQAQLAIHTTPGDLEIDQTQAFNQEGLKSSLTLSRDEAAKAQSVVAQGITDRVQWGNRFADLAHHSVDIGQYSTRNWAKQPQLEVALVPSPFSVHISYQMSQLSIQAQPQPVQVTATPSPVHISAQPGTAQSYLDQAPSVQISSPPVSQLIDVKI